MFARSRSLRFAHPSPRHPPNSHKSTGWVSISLITDKVVVVVVARNIVSNMSEATEVNSMEKETQTSIEKRRENYVILSFESQLSNIIIYTCASVCQLSKKTDRKWKLVKSD